MRWVMLWLMVLLAPAGARAGEAVSHARIDLYRSVSDVNRDLTFTRTLVTDKTLLTERGVRNNDRAAYTFYPEQQAVELVEAWVDQPDGSRVMVAASSVFTRPSRSSESAPGFVSSLTTTVVFPQLRPGSRTHVAWRFTQKTPALLGFNPFSVGTYSWDSVVDETIINLPADVAFRWGARDVDVEDTVSDGKRRIVARIAASKGREAETAMVHQWDFMPLFLGTTLPDAEAIGATIHRAAQGRAAVTPEIAALAEKVAGGKTGLEAARALHAWVAGHIRYVAVYLSPDEGYVPHAASEVLKAGYGDCKDYVVLMQALLAARGIEAEMAVLNWGDMYADPPLVTPYFANHAILYLPAFDHYVNPTDRYAGFDSLTNSLSGKLVVHVTPTGRLTRTPEPTWAANRYHYQAELTLAADGSIAGSARYMFAANTEIGMRSALVSASSLDDLARRLLANTLEGGFGALTASDPNDLLRPLSLSATWRSPRAVNVQGGRTYLRIPAGLDPYPVTGMRGLLSQSGARQTPLNVGVRDNRWTTTLRLPPGVALRETPPDVAEETLVGTYSARYRLEGDRLTADRHLVVNRVVVSEEDYGELERLVYAAQIDARAVVVVGR